MVPYRRCPGCGLRFYAGAGHALQVSCPECETVLRATVVAAGDVNAWLARRIVAELPAGSRSLPANSTAGDGPGGDA